jgi:hypothetical protein
MEHMNDGLDWLLGRLGQPIPCEICRVPTPAADLTECLVPGALIAEFDIIIDRVVWVCLTVQLVFIFIYI